MNEKMKLWECQYTASQPFKAGTYSFHVKDWIWSTSKPSDSSIGHYWQVRDYSIRDATCHEVEYSGGELKAELTDYLYSEA